jgi:hypothetical protein
VAEMPIRAVFGVEAPLQDAHSDCKTHGPKGDRNAPPRP